MEKTMRVWKRKARKGRKQRNFEFLLKEAKDL